MMSTQGLEPSDVVNAIRVPSGDQARLRMAGAVSNLVVEYPPLPASVRTDSERAEPSAIAYATRLPSDDAATSAWTPDGGSDPMATTWVPCGSAIPPSVAA